MSNITESIGSTSSSTQTNNTMSMIGHCLKLLYYRGPVEGWMEATNGLVIAVNIVSALITITANSLFLVIYFKTKSLRTPHYFFLMTLAVADIGVGLTSQPLFIARKFMEIYGAHDCVLWTATRATIYYFSCVSLLTLTLVSIERYLAICWPIYHRNNVTHNSMAKVAFTVWLAWLLMPIVRFAVPENYIVLRVFTFIIILVLLVINAFLYFKIHQTVFGKNPGEHNQRPPKDLTKESRLMKTVACLMLVMILSFLPTVIGLVYKAVVVGVDTAYLFGYLAFAETLVLLNSSFNPLFYCYRNENIREAIYKYLRGDRRPTFHNGLSPVEPMETVNV